MKRLGLFTIAILMLLGLIDARPAASQTQRGIMPGLHAGVQTGPAFFTRTSEADRSGGRLAGLAVLGNLSYQVNPYWGLGLHYGHIRFGSKTGLTSNQHEIGIWLRTTWPGTWITPYVQWGAHWTTLAGNTRPGALLQLGTDWHLDPDRMFTLTAGARVKTGQAGPPATNVHGLAALHLGLRLRLARRYPVPYLNAVVVPDSAYVGQRVWLEAHVGGQPDTKKYAYAWTLGDSLTLRGNPIDYIFHEPGTYRLTVTVTNASGTDTWQRHLVVLPAAAAPAPAATAPLGERLTPPRIVAIYGQRTLEVGQIENFHVRVSAGVRRPVQHRWDMGDGTIALGNNVSHSYAEPGTYVVTVRSHNTAGTDEDTIHVRVVEPTASSATDRADAGPDAPDSEVTAPPRSTPQPVDPPAGSSSGSTPAQTGPLEAMLKSGGESVVWARGGYTWVVSTSLNRFAAETLAQQYRRAGYRVGVWTDDTGPGTKAYRVVLGQFATEAQALEVRARVQEETPNQIWLFQIPSSPEE